MIDTELPVTEVAIGSPTLSVEMPLVSCSDEEVLDVWADSVRVAVASTPFGIGVSLRPHVRQVMAPGLGWQDRDIFPAAGPAVHVADEKSAVE
jgi:hypothetical protein